MNLSKERKRLLKSFEKHYGPGPVPRASLAPGRVNLIGEHTDYNGGLVLPMAIDRHTAVLFRSNKSDTIRAYAEGINAHDEFNIQNIERAASVPPASRRHESVRNVAPSQHWSNYVRGVAWSLSERGVKLKGGDLYIANDLPIGAGLSSSASIEVATGLALLALAGAKMDAQTLALACQRAEHEFTGVCCGIMDQTVVARARTGHALLLDCRSLEITHIPINLKSYSFALFDTGVRHALASSEYNKRRAACEHAAKLFGRATLRDVSLDDLLAKIGKLNATEEKCVRHVHGEDLRVVQFAAALERGDVAELGTLLKASHVSLMQDYEVSCAELDAIVFELVQPCCDKEPCPGARMTGGGFGGSVVALLKTAKFKTYEKVLGKLAPHGGMLLKPGDGAKVFAL
ncbi:MAG TPA: galactokinase [Planctomycetota bacterium]|nr:galactokinase [Planctomycetota bacterium]